MILSISGVLKWALILWIIWIVFKVLRFFFKAAVVYYVAKNKIMNSKPAENSKNKSKKIDYEGDYVDYEEVKE